MAFEIKIEGAESIIAKFEKLSDISHLEDGVKQASLVVEREAKMKAPKMTGELSRSISSRVESNGGTINGIIYSPLEYAPYVEYGTGLFAEKGGRQAVPWRYKDIHGNWHETCGMHPSPYLRPALLDNSKEILEAIKGGLKL